mmetsp:Transcript_107483/g.229489  ORF Transcript_107483/g.229489 Transcript_107483/m.229489 type:complete len:389 (-) Transcript_107483:2-1168(-)
MDLEDVRAALEVWQAVLHFAVQAPRPQQGWIQGVRPIRRHEDLDIPTSLEAIKLIHNLQHGPLNLAVAVCLIASARAADGIDLVDEENASFLCSGELKELTHHARSLTDIALHQLGANDADEASVGTVCDRPRRQGLSSAWRAIQQHALRWVNAQRYEALRLKERHLDDLAQALELLLGAANVVVRNIGLLLNCHHGHAGIYLGRQGDLNAVLSAMRGVHSHAHSLFNVRPGDLLPKADHELSELADLDDVLGVIGSRVDDLRAAGHLQGLLLLHHLLVAFEVPLARRRQACIRLLDTNELVDGADQVLRLLLPLFDDLDVGPNAIGAHDVHVFIIETGRRLLIVVHGLVRRLLLHRCVHGIERHVCQGRRRLSTLWWVVSLWDWVRP